MVPGRSHIKLNNFVETQLYGKSLFNLYKNELRTKTIEFKSKYRDNKFCSQATSFNKVILQHIAGLLYTESYLKILKVIFDVHNYYPSQRSHRYVRQGV